RYRGTSRSQQSSCSRYGGCAVPDTLAVHVRRADATAQRPAGIRRQLVTLLKRTRLDGPFSIGIPYDKVGVEASRDAALAIAEPGERRRSHAHPAAHRIQSPRLVPWHKRRRDFVRMPRLLRVRPNRREAHLERRDPAPRGREIAGTFHRRRRWRVIGRDEVERARAQTGPQGIAMPRLANRRRALELGGTGGNLPGRERQIVRARFRRDPYAIGLRARDRVDAFRAGDVDDVDVRAELARQTNHHVDRGDLGLRWTSREVASVHARLKGSRSFQPEVRRQLCVDEQRNVAPLENGHGVAQLALAHHWKFVDPRRHEKTFEAADAGVDERVELARAARDDAAPERDVDVALPT